MFEGKKMPFHREGSAILVEFTHLCFLVQFLKPDWMLFRFAFRDVILVFIFEGFNVNTVEVQIIFFNVG